ncbi:MAG TPA: LysR family transcriptional regulator, partial [Gammaproteobacteria bacterium]|nr:LysR family transcriptional regulator [Gammaproteobacteria bacterium]
MIDIKHLKTLAAVRDRGSLAAAAKSLNVTQSALSHQIKNLEQLMDMEFLVRQGRKLQFTRAGERLLQLADDVLPRIRSAQLDLKQIKSGRSGRLHIAVECHSCFEWLIPTMNNYRNDWPEVE